MSNQLCHARPKNFDINFNENSKINSNITHGVSVDKCGGSCNIIDDSYARICFPNKVKNKNVKVLDLISEINKTRVLLQHESYKCKRRLQNKNGTMMIVSVSVKN